MYLSIGFIPFSALQSIPNVCI